MFIVDSLGLTSVNLMQLAPRVLVLREITHDWRPVRRSRSLKVIDFGSLPIESSYATSYKCNLCHISHRCRVIVAHWFKLSSLTGECFYLIPSFAVNHWTMDCKIWLQKLESLLSRSCSVQHISIHRTVQALITSVTDRQTDKTVIAIACVER